MRKLCSLICSLLIFSLTTSAVAQKSISQEYAPVAGQIVGSALVEGQAYEKLTYLTDRIGNRISGSAQLDQAIQWAVKTMKEDGLENVHTEPVKVPHWVRGSESAEIVAPTKHKLTILGLGGTVGTPPEGITAEVIEVKNFEELEKLGEQVKGKIVFYSYAMRKDIPSGQAYGDAVQYRGSGAIRAAKQGAVAALVRSVTTVSLSTPHTGAMRYQEDVPKIPAAAVTIENAELIHRLLAAGNRVSVTLKLGAQTLPDADSANVIGELRGREFPEEIVLVSGHIDSWDVGNGANDDGAGCVMVMEAVRTLVRLKLRPRRTIRVVLFTNEENGLKGAQAYGDAHKQEVDKHIAALESDSGAARPIGFSFSGKDTAFGIIKDIAPLLTNISADNMVSTEGAGADVSVLTKAGVPGLGFRPDGTHYFDIHHTEADTLDKINRLDLALDVAAIAVMSYVIADLPESLKR